MIYLMFYLLIGCVFEVFDIVTSLEHRPKSTTIFNLVLWPLALVGIVLGLIDEMRGQNDR